MSEKRKEKLRESLTTDYQHFKLNIMIIDDLKKRLNRLELIKQAKNAIANGLQIEWETDPEKMQFQKLRSYDSLKDFFNLEILRIDQFNITNYLLSSPETLFTGSDNKSYIEMVEILMKGGKLIPPAVSEKYAIVDGQEEKVETYVGINDGYHRATLANFMGQNVIPVVVFKQCANEYWFTPGKWNFEGPRIREEQRSENSFSYIEYNGFKAISKETGKVFTFKDSSTFIDDSNTDYLVVQTR